MSEVAAELDVTKKSGAARVIRLGVLDSRRFFRGGGKEKWAIAAEITRNSRHKPLALVERDFGQDTNRIVEVWKRCKDVGIPVVPTLGITQRGTVVMTDLRADGSELYGKSLVFYSHGEKREPSELDSIFLQILSDTEKLKAIKEEAIRLAVKAGESGIAMPIDDPFELLVKPDGTFSLICLDLELGLYSPLEFLTQNDIATKIDSNVKCVDKFGTSLQYAKLLLSGQPINGVKITNIFETIDMFSS